MIEIVKILLFFYKKNHIFALNNTFFLNLDKMSGIYIILILAKELYKKIVRYLENCFLGEFKKYMIFL